MVEAVRMPKQSRRNAAISILARSGRDMSMLEIATKDHAEVLTEAGSAGGRRGREASKQGGTSTQH